MVDTGIETLTLAAEFPAATRDQWLKLVDGVLKGAAFDKRLVGRSHDGLAIQPLYPRAAAATPLAGRPARRAWRVTQRVDHPDAAAANAEALHDLENGATGLALVFAGAAGANGFGLDVSAETLSAVLDGIYLDAGVAIELQIGPHATAVPGHLADYLAAKGVAPAACDIRFGYDPLGAMAATGASPHAWSAIAPTMAPTVRDLAANGFAGPFCVADGRVVHAAGGSEAQELAFALAVAVAYLRALEAGGMPLPTARDAVWFRLAADADQFLTTAKFRALRKLWARVEQACGLDAEPAFVAAETAWRMLTRRDPWVNMLRATIATVAAGLGGADSVTVLPFTAALGLPDRFARRVARNTQLILLEESNLAKVADPAAGAGGIEGLTDQLSRAAWTLFQEIEAAGGAGVALENGSIQGTIAKVRAEREAAVAKRRDPLTGTSEFPDIHEAPVAVLDVQPVTPPAFGPATVTLPALAPMRLAAPFEALRDASDAALAATEQRPSVFLANLGPIAAFTARAMFAKNLFEAGGIVALGNDGFAGHAEMSAAFNASGARIACLCSSDEVYATEAVAAAQALTAAGATHLYLAGRPGELQAPLEAAGVEGFVYFGCDVLATLRAAHGILGLGK